MKLERGMFGSEFSPKNVLGLRCGQMRGGDSKIGHNSGWYNQLGEKLGFGDLSTADLVRVQAALEPGQFFVVLGERDSFWAFVTHYGPLGSMCERSANEQAPGLDYIAEKFRFALSPKVIYVPIEVGVGEDGKECFYYSKKFGRECLFISKEGLKARIQTAATEGSSS